MLDPAEDAPRSRAARKTARKAMAKAGQAVRKMSGDALRAVRRLGKPLHSDDDDDDYDNSAVARDDQKNATRWCPLILSALLFAVAIACLAQSRRPITESKVLAAATAAAPAGDAVSGVDVVKHLLTPNATALEAEASEAAAAALSQRERTLDEQQQALARREAVPLSCRSTGNMHLLAALRGGDDHLGSGWSAPVRVRCPAGCGAPPRQHAGLWGDKHAGYQCASLACVAARDATGEDGGEFIVRVALDRAQGGAAGAAAAAAVAVASSCTFTITLHKQLTAQRDEAAVRKVRAKVRSWLLDGLHMQAPAGGVALRFLEIATAQPGRNRPHGDLVGEAADDFDGLLRALFNIDEKGVTDGFHTTAKGLLGVPVEVSAAIANAIANTTDAAAQKSAYLEESKTFSHMDANGDGLVDLSEYLAGFQAFEATLHAVLSRFDADGDGEVSRRELAAMQEQDRDNVFIPKALVNFRQNLPQPQREL